MNPPGETHIGWIGAGIMGLPMAAHLIKAGYRLCVCTRTPARAEPLLQAGASFAPSPRHLAQTCHIIFTCVPDSTDVEEVLLGELGLLSGVRDGACRTVVDHSTISPRTTQWLARRLAQAGVQFLDAPVSGGQIGAQNATLSIMVGGDPAVLEQVRPILAHMGRSIVHCGPSGYGQFTKLANQICGALNMLAMSEAIAFGSSAGLNLHQMVAAISSGAAANWAITHMGPRVLKADYEPGFMIDLQQKDLRLVLAAAREIGQPLPGTALTQQLFAVNQAHGEGQQGTQALVKTILKLGSKGPQSLLKPAQPDAPDASPPGPQDPEARR